jgi:phosphoribosyl 1,2-cyclic phosphodiesterase
MIECNWSKETLIDRDHNYKYHLSLDKCISILKKIDMKNVNNIVLIHLSNINSNKNMFVQRVKEETHIRNVFAADKIKTIEFNKNAF